MKRGKISRGTSFSRGISCLLAILSASCMVACGDTGGGFNSNIWDNEGSYSVGQQWADDVESVEGDTTSDLPQPSEPNPDKTLLRTEVDGIGHKIAYYEDGTQEDLGRVVPMDFHSPEPEKQYAYTVLSNESKGQGLCAFYKDLYAEAVAFHDSTATLKPTLEQGQKFYVVAKINFARHGLRVQEAISVWKAFNESNPSFYWISSTLLYSDSVLWFLAEEPYAKYSVRREIDDKIAEMAVDCETYLSGSTSLAERALTIFDYVTYRVEYAYKSDGKTPRDDVWAHNVVGSAMYGQGVCETYAQTYDFLCDVFGIECITVVGDAGKSAKEREGHAWNYLCLDGEWYAVDATWADQADGIFRQYFGIDLKDYKATHSPEPSGNWGIEYQCTLPTLSGGLCPVRVRKEQEKSVLTASIEKALETMTDEQGAYEITLYPHTEVTTRAKVNIFHRNAKIYATVLPKVKRITFLGRKTRISLADTYFYLTSLTADTKVTLSCNVTFKDVEYTPSQWIKGNYQITNA